MESPTYSLINRGGVGRASCDCYCTVTASAPRTVKWCAINSGAERTAFYPSNDCSTWPSLCLFQHTHTLACTQTHMSKHTHEQHAPPHMEALISLAVHYSMVMLLWCGPTFLALDKGCRLPNLPPIPVGPEPLSAAQGRFEPRVRTSAQDGPCEGGFLVKVATEQSNIIWNPMICVTDNSHVRGQTLFHGFKSRMERLECLWVGWQDMEGYSDSVHVLEIALWNYLSKNSTPSVLLPVVVIFVVFLVLMLPAPGHCMYTAHTK